MKAILTLLLFLHLLDVHSQISAAQSFSNDYIGTGSALEHTPDVKQRKRRRRPVKRTYLIPSFGLRSINLGSDFHSAYTAAMAIRMTKDVQYHEIKVAGHVNEYMESFQFGTALRGTEIEYIGFDVGYAYGRTVFSNSIFQLNGSGISRIGYRDVNENPFTARDYPSDTRRYLFGLGVQGEFLVHLYKTIDIGLAADIPLLDIFRERKTIDNPILLSRDRISKTNGTSFFSRELALRLSILFQMG